MHPIFLNNSLIHLTRYVVTRICLSLMLISNVETATDRVLMLERLGTWAHNTSPTLHIHPKLAHLDPIKSFDVIFFPLGS